MKICIIYGHYNITNSFNAAIRDTFIEEAKKCGHEIDLINLFEEEQLPFYNANINPPPKIVLDYRKRLENSDVMFLIGSCHNLRMPSILENWVDWVLHPKWFFSYRALVPGSKYFKLRLPCTRCYERQVRTCFDHIWRPNDDIREFQFVRQYTLQTNQKRSVQSRRNAYKIH